MTSGIDGTSQTPPAVGAASPRKSGIQRIVGALFSPGETFREIAERPDFLAPLLVIVVISIVSVMVVVPRIDFESMIREQMSQTNPDMAEEDRERAVRFGAAFTKAMFYVSPLLAPILVTIIAGILLLAFRLFGGEGNFKQAFSVTLYSWMPMIVGGIVGTIILVGRGGSVSAEELQTLVMSNLGFLVDQKENMVAFAFLSSIDLFTLWTLVLLIIGFAYVARVSRAVSSAIVLSLWAILVVIKVGLAAMGAARMKG